MHLSPRLPAALLIGPIGWTPFQPEDFLCPKRYYEFQLPKNGACAAVRGGSVLEARAIAIKAMFLTSPELYDAIYHFKDYAKECAMLRELIGASMPRARTLLDVACGTGEHAKFLKDHYSVDGVDLNPEYLTAARGKNPAGIFEQADMTDFDLHRTYDVVTCLFSAIGYVASVERMNRAVACMARHVSAARADCFLYSANQSL
jgi:SAM-dependent methyltransferase